MKRVLAGLVVLAVLGSAAGVQVLDGQADTGASDWPQPRHDAGRTGYNPAATGPETDVGPAWINRIGSGGVGDVSPTVADGTVYVGNNDGELYAFDARDGERIWQTAVGPHVRSAAAVGGERVFVVVEDEGPDESGVVAVERETGEVDWRYAPEHPETPAAWDTDTSRDYEYTDWDEVAAFANDFAAFVEGRLGVVPDTTEDPAA